MEDADTAVSDTSYQSLQQEEEEQRKSGPRL